MISGAEEAVLDTVICKLRSLDRNARGSSILWHSTAWVLLASPEMDPALVEKELIRFAQIPHDFISLNTSKSSNVSL